MLARRFRNLTLMRPTLIHPHCRASVDTTRHLVSAKYMVYRRPLRYRLCRSVRAARQPSVVSVTLLLPSCDGS